jgi:selenocysteine lyase/cysteine desulfurase
VKSTLKQLLIAQEQRFVDPIRRRHESCVKGRVFHHSNRGSQKGWFGQSNHSKFDIHQLTQAPGARRFETGTPSFISAYAATAAIRLLLEIGVENISSYLNQLAQFALDYGQEKGLQVADPRSADQRGAMTAFYVENAGRIESIMKERNIIVSARNDVIRIAPHFYNTQDEVRQAIDELATVLNTK